VIAPSTPPAAPVPAADPSAGVLTLPRRLALLTAVLAVLLVTGSTEIGLRLSERARLNDLEEESVDLATTLAAYLTRISPTGEPSALLVGLGGWSRRHITETTAIVFVLVEDQLLPAAASDSTVNVDPSELDRRALIEGRPIAWFSGDPHPAQEVAVPLGGHEAYGVLHVTVSTGRLDEWAHAERRRALLLALTAALLVAIGVALLTSRWVGRPLSSLTGAMAGAHGGAEGSPEAREVGPPEFRLLARRYNELRNALVQRQRESEARAGLLSLEDRARNYDRLTQAEEIAAAFAHEIGTPLNTINGHLQLMREDLLLSGDLPGEERVDLLLAQLDRVAKIVRSRLERGGWPAPAGDPIDLHELARRMLRFLEPSLDAARVNTTLAPSPVGAAPMAQGDSDLVEQVLLNLLKNAIEALPPGGQIEITTGTRDSRAFVEVRDDGPGLPTEARTQLFQPFVTTKPLGTGLGLAVSRRLARALGGELSFVPTDRGTCWQLTLPLYEAA
jgi:signal transduction histidine kinase